MVRNDWKVGKEEEDKETIWQEIEEVRNRCIYKIWEDRCKTQAEWTTTRGITKKTFKEKRKGKSKDVKKKNPKEGQPNSRDSVDNRSNEKEKKKKTRPHNKGKNKEENLVKWLRKSVREHESKLIVNYGLAEHWLTQRAEKELWGKDQIYIGKAGG